MAIKDTHDKNGMIPKEELEYVLELVAIDMNSLSGCYTHLEHIKYELLKIESPPLKERYDTETLLNVHQINTSLMKFYRNIFNRNAKDFYEFFYQTSGFDKHSFYAVQFPIDKRKFVKMRVAGKLVKNALRNKRKNALKIVEMMYQNKDAFLDSLTVKVKKPKITKLDFELYRKWEEELKNERQD